MTAAGPALVTLGTVAELRETHVALIAALGCTAPPTVRVDGADVQPEAHLSC